VFAGKAKKMMKKQTPGYDKGRKLGWFKKALLKYFFVKNPSLQSCMMKTTVPDFNGTLEEFVYTSGQYETTSSLGTSVLNGSPSSCPLIQSLNQGLSDSANSTNTTTLQEGNAFVQQLTTEFASTTDVVLRLKYCSAQFSQLSSACRDLLKPFKITGTMLGSLDFGDVMVASHFCTNNGCGNMTYGPPSMTYPETCMLDPAYDISDMEDAVNGYYANLASVYKMSFNSTKNAITNCIRTMHPGNYPAKYECAKYYVKNVWANNPTQRAIFLSTEIVSVLIETATTVVFGKFSNFCSCS
jgi:hypothetical protein